MFYLNEFFSYLRSLLVSQRFFPLEPRYFYNLSSIQKINSNFQNCNIPSLFYMHFLLFITSPPIFFLLGPCFDTSLPNEAIKVLLFNIRMPQMTRRKKTESPAEQTSYVNDVEQFKVSQPCSSVQISTCEPMTLESVH